MFRKSLGWTLSLAGLAALLATGAALAQGKDSVFVDEDAAHATIERLDQKDIQDDVYPVLLVRVDGEAVVNGERKFVTVTPGEHVLRVKPDLQAVREYQPHSGRNQPPPNMNLQESNLTVDMKEGYVYKVAVRRKGTSWTDFTPFVLKSWPAEAEEPEAAE